MESDSENLPKVKLSKVKSIPCVITGCKGVDVQRQLVGIWLDNEGNSGKQVLLAYQLGYREGLSRRFTVSTISES